MKSKRFEIIISIFIGVLLLTTSFFAYLNTVQKPILNNSLLNEDNEGISVFDQYVKFSFKRPMNKDSFKDKIIVEPEIAFNTKWVGGRDFFVFFSKRLDYSTNYKVTILEGVKDIYGKSSDKEFSKEFKTKDASFYYLDVSTDKDKLMKARIDGSDTSTIFEASHIELYDFNQNFVTLVTANEDQENDIVLINLGTNEQTIIDLGSAKVNNISVSKNTNVLYFTSQKINRSGDFIIPEGTNQVRYIDLDTKDLEPNLLDLSAQATDVLDMRLSPDGNLLLIRGNSSNFFLINLTDTSQVLSVGQLSAISDFNNDGLMLFTDFDLSGSYDSFPYVIQIDNERNQLIASKRGEYSIDGSFLHDTKGIVYAKKLKELTGAQGFFGIYLKNLETAKEDLIIKADNLSFELPKVTPDDKYLIAESYSGRQLLNYVDRRNYGFQLKPGIGTLVIVDLKNAEVVTKIPNAIEAKIIE